ncbi:MAG: hypothetical protein IV100_18155 [Myxococcales bacterium]|nr:hypothetical protein [Myxococcales bacterium]
MAVLRQFSEVELDRLAYITRHDKDLLQQTMTNALARAERAASEADPYVRYSNSSFTRPGAESRSRPSGRLR